MLRCSKGGEIREAQTRDSYFAALTIPIKCFVSHRPPSREGGSVGRAKRKRVKTWRALGASEGRAAKPVVSTPNTVTAPTGKGKP